MDNNQTKVIKRLANEFFEAARDNVCNKYKGKNFLIPSSEIFVEGPLLGMDNNVREKQEILVRKCVRVLGVELGSEEEIEELAWNCFWQSFSDNKPISDISQITEHFLHRITQCEQRIYGYLAPNFVIEFSGQAQKFVIGPIKAMQTEYFIANLQEIRKHAKIRERISIIIPIKPQVGSKYDFSISDDGISMELPKSCWCIPMGSIKAARRNFDEQAIWSINVAISLLRLCYPQPKHSKYPRVGDIEEMPLAEPKRFELDISNEEKGLVLYEIDEPINRDEPTNRPSVGIKIPVSSSIRRVPCTYLVDDAVVALTEEQKFKDKVNVIFNPGKNSLAERFGQGLGWLTRGRQTVDRAERLLFFFTAIEALLSSGDKSAPVVQTISRHAATILHTDPLERAKLASQLRSLYGVRSRLVHAGERNVSQADSMETQRIAEQLYKAVMENYSLESKFDEFQKSLSEAGYGLPWPLPKPSSSSPPTGNWWSRCRARFGR